jgi:hypothetical protein
LSQPAISRAAATIDHDFTAHLPAFRRGADRRRERLCEARVDVDLEELDQAPLPLQRLAQCQLSGRDRVPQRRQIDARAFDEVAREQRHGGVSRLERRSRAGDFEAHAAAHEVARRLGGADLRERLRDLTRPRPSDRRR